MRTFVLVVVAAIATAIVPAHASHLSVGCQTTASGPIAGTGPSCSITLACERETPGSCAWSLTVRAGTFGFVGAEITDEAGNSYAGCFGTPSCEGTSRRWVQLDQGERLTLTCSTIIIGVGAGLGCFADQSLP